jgi:transposase
MSEEFLFPQDVLGIPELRVTGVQTTREGVILEAEIVLAKGVCPECRTICTKVHQKLHRRVRHLPVFGRACWIRFAHRQLECQGCGKTFAPEVGFLLTPDAQHTRACAQWLYDRVRGSSIKVVAELEGIPERTLQDLYYAVATERDQARHKQGPQQT